MRSVPTLITNRHPTAILNPTYHPFLIWIYQDPDTFIVFQIKKAYKTEPALDDALRRRKHWSLRIIVPKSIYIVC